MRPAADEPCQNWRTSILSMIAQKLLPRRFSRSGRTIKSIHKVN
jgi:hypothetical protein